MSARTSEEHQPTFVYKILRQSEWPMKETEQFPTPLDAADGFIHLSNARQAQFVADRFFSDSAEIVVVTIAVAALEGRDLRWEAPVHPPTPTALPPSSTSSAASAGGGDGEQQMQQRFPHLYGSRLDAGVVAAVWTVARSAAGSFDLSGLAF
ncbi:hypothetical protein DFJ73DRAFT_248937 [Zopfochytrium polystomum]|nr:hypothetical protein DFJ73DRAFT_248937 [Zopfochytrium polystomum]